MANSIFRKQSLDRVNSPEELNDYIKTSKPGVWLVVLAVLILLASIFVWAIFGSLDTSVPISGVVKGDTVTCFTNKTSNISVGNEVRIGDMTGTVVSVSSKPISLADATALADTDAYTLYCLDLAEWNYVVEISVDDAITDGYVSAEVVTEKISPISFMFG